VFVYSSDDDAPETPMTMAGEPAVRPEDLNDADRRVYDLASTTTPLAEIAVRLGVSIGEAERRIAILLARMGMPDRAALRGLPGYRADARADALTEAPDPAPVVPHPPPRRRRTSVLRRASLALPLLIALAVAAGAAYEMRPGDAEGAAHPGGAAEAPAATPDGS
jgi:hypothetical protein